MTPSTSDPLLWSGVLFVRSGPYVGAILRFSITFPLSPIRPRPPLVVICTDIFHPLVTPLTTYSYSSDVRDGGTISAADDTRLPPGGFSLVHGFPAYFSGNTQPTLSADPSVYQVLHYLKSAFDDEAVLDSVPREAAANTGAWDAWQARDRDTGKNSGAPRTGRANTITEEKELPPIPGPFSPSLLPASAPRAMTGWNWSGVWAERVRKGVKASYADQTLYNNTGLPEDAVSMANFEVVPRSQAFLRLHTY